MIQKLIEATLQAPSGHNRQPWRFIIIQGDKKVKFETLLLDVLNKRKGMGGKTGTFKRTIGCIKRSDTVILVFNGLSNNGQDESPEMNKLQELIDIQSIGGAIQTMLLAAYSLGIGSLWIGDVLYAKKEIGEWISREDQLVAAVSLGYADEEPSARPRMKVDEVIEWL